MSKTSVSFVVGTKTSLAHNNRENIHGNPDIDVERIKDNITYKRENIRDVYDREFSEALTEYNGKQKRNDRKIKDYFSHMLHNESTNHQKEIIVQVGKVDDGIDWDTKKNILDQYAKEFEKENPNLKVYNSVMHLDEATPHLHINYVPVADGNKNGLKKKVANNKAIEQMGYAKGKTGFIQWQEAQRTKLANLMDQQGIKRELVGKRKYLDVPEYKEMITEVENMKAELNQANNQISKLTNEKASLEKEVKEGNVALGKVEKKLEVRSEVLKEVNNIDKVQPKKHALGGIKEDSYKRMEKVAKGAVATRDKYKDFAVDRGEVIAKQKAEIAKLKSNANRMSADNVSLRNENQVLKKELSKVDKFLEKYNLTKAYKAFVKVLEKAIDVMRSGERER